MAAPSILIVEDDQNIQAMLQYHLHKQNYTTYEAIDTIEAKAALNLQLPSLILLDWSLPAQDGFSFMKELKQQAKFKHIPVIFLTARDDEQGISQALDEGAADYILKPFRVKEMLARIRRTLVNQTAATTVYHYHELAVNPDQRSLKINGTAIKLSRSEFEIICLLIQQQGTVLSRNQIIEAVQGEGHPVTDRVVDVHIANLRRKLKEAGRYIQTVWGVGYCLTD